MNGLQKVKKCIYLPVMGLLMLLASCNSNEHCADLGTCPDNALLERTDIYIYGDFGVNDHQSVENGAAGPVTFLAPGDPSEFEIVLRLEDESELTIRMVNQLHADPWNDVGLPYDVYTAQEMDDKYQYITATLTRGKDAAGYSTHLGNFIPQHSIVNAFEITAFDGNILRGRIRDLVLTKNIDLSKAITINGTFTGIFDVYQP